MNSLAPLRLSYAASPSPLGFVEVGIHGRPPLRALVLSICLHGLAVAGVVAIPVPKVAAKARQTAANADPTVVRIAERLYYVTDLSRPEPDTAPAPANGKGAEKKTTAGAAGSASAAAAGKKGLETGSDLDSNPGLRQFIPRDARRNPDSDTTLIQPLLPPVELQVAPPVPSVVIATAQLRSPQIPKPFVVPGRQTPKPPDPLQPIPLPNLDLVRTDPVVSNIQPFAVLPDNWPSPAEAPPPKLVAAVSPPTLPGDPVEILALTSKPVPQGDQLVVPPGNIIGRNADGGAAGSNSTAPTSNGGKSNGPSASPAPATDATASSAAATQANPVSRTAQANPANSANSGAPTVTHVQERSPESGPAGSAAVGPAVGSVATPASAAPAGSRGSPDGDAGKSLGTPRPKNMEVTILGGAGSGLRRKPAGETPIIVRPANGTFDSVIVQSSPLEQFPGGKGLLTGRPIYTVYLSLDTPKDWAFYFSLPVEPQPASTSLTNTISVSSAPIQGPYATRMVRPRVDVPSYVQNILVHGFVNAQGRFENLRIVKPIRPEIDQALLTSLAGWEFRAATKDGVKTAVEFLMAIPVAGL